MSAPRYPSPEEEIILIDSTKDRVLEPSSFGGDSGSGNFFFPEPASEEITILKLFLKCGFKKGYIRYIKFRHIFSSPCDRQFINWYF